MNLKGSILTDCYPDTKGYITVGVLWQKIKKKNKKK